MYITIEKPGAFSGFNEESAINYFRALQRGQPFLKKEVVDPFEKALKGSSGWSKDNLPTAKDEQEISLGDYVFQVVTETRRKKPSNKLVYESFRDFVGFLREQYDKDIRREGIVTFDSEPYVLMGNLFEKYDSLRAGQDEKELKQSLKVPLVESPHNLVVPLVDYSVLNVQNVGVYVPGKALFGYMKKETGKFDQELKSRTGFDKQNIPEKTELNWFQLGNVLFRVQTVPGDVVKQTKILNALFYQTPTGKVTKKTGELVLANLGQDVGIDSKVRNDKRYLSFMGLERRMEELLEENTVREIERQTIACYPVV